MKILAIYLGGQDFNRYWGLELTLLGASVFIGIGHAHWLVLRLEFNLGWFSTGMQWNTIRKDITAERFLEMISRHLFPGWLKK